MPSSLHQYICQFPEDSSTPPYGEAPKLKWALHFYTCTKKDSFRQGISLSYFIVSYKPPKYELEAITQWSQRDHKSRKEAKIWSQDHLTLCILGKPENSSYNSPKTECRPCSYYSCIEWGPISHTPKVPLTVNHMVIGHLTVHTGHADWLGTHIPDVFRVILFIWFFNCELFLNYCSWKIRSLHTCLPILKLYQVENTTYIVFLQLMEHGIYAVSLSRALESHSNYSTYCYCFCFLGTDLLFPLILVAASALRPNHPIFLLNACFRLLLLIVVFF